MNYAFLTYLDPYWRQIITDFSALDAGTIHVFQGEGNNNTQRGLPKNVLASIPYDLLESGTIANSNIVQRPLSRQEIQSLYQCESIFLSITDRVSYYPISVYKRKQIYYNLLRFFFHFFAENAISKVVFPRVPHMPAEYVAYGVAQYLGLPTIMPERTLFNHISVLLQDIDTPRVMPANFASHLSLEECKQAIQISAPHFLPTSEQASWWLERSRNINEELKKTQKKNLITPLKKILNNTPITILRKIVHKVKAYHWKTVSFSPFFYNPRFLSNHISVTLHKHAHKIIVRKRLAHYQQLAHKELPSEPYIYLPLHFQPERSSLPAGNVFYDQLLLAKNIAAALPQGWKLVIKEHPRQFTADDMRNIHARDTHFYTRLADLPNTTLVPCHMNSDAIVDKAQAIATTTGSTGWEGLMQAKPCLLFGCPWYAPCKSAYHVSSVHEIAQALETIRTTDQPAVLAHVYSFLLWLTENSVPAACSHFDLLQSPGASIQYHARTMAQALYSKLHQCKGSLPNIH